MIFLSVIIFIALIIIFNFLLINFFNIDLFYYFNKEIILYGFLILSIIYVFYFIVIDVDQTLSKEKQEKIIKNMDFLIITIFLLALFFGNLYSRFISDELFLKIFMYRHNLTLNGFITVNNVRLVFIGLKYFIIFISVGSIIFLLELIGRLFYPKNLINFIKKIFSFNVTMIGKEMKEENEKDGKFIIKTILINIINFILFIYNKFLIFINKITNKKFNLEIGHQIVDENGQIIAIGNEKSYINGTTLNNLNNNIKVQEEDNQSGLNGQNGTKQASIIDYGSNIISKEGQVEINNNLEGKGNINKREDILGETGEKNLNIPEQNMVMGSITNPTNPEIIRQTNELNNQIVEQNPGIENKNIINGIDYTNSFRKLETVNFPVNLIRTGKIYFENNCIFLNQESIQYKDYIIRYYKSIISDKNNIKKLEDVNGIFIIIYYDPIFGLVLIPKITERWSVTNMSVDIIKYFDQVFFKLDFFPAELSEWFKDYSSSIEKIQNTIVYYIVAKHEYDGKNRQENPTQYKPFLLKDIYKQIWGDDYNEKLNNLQMLNKNKYLGMDNDQRLSLLKEKYGIFFGKRKLSFAKDVNIEYNWNKIDNKLIFNNTIYNAKHLALLGKTGWGKTVLLKNIIYSFLSKNEVDGVDFYMIDPKTELIKEFYNYKQVKYISTDIDKHKNLLKYLVHVMTERQSQIQKNDWTETFEATGKLFKPIVLIIEEFVDLSTELDNFSKSLITKLLVKGRSSGIYVIAVAQFYRAKIFGAVGSQFTLMSVYNEDPETSKKMTGNESYLSKLGMGEMLYTDTFNQMYVRVPYEKDYEGYLNNSMFRYKQSDDNTWKEQRLKFNIDFFSIIIKLYLEGDYSIAATCAKNFNERVHWTSSFLKFELVYIYIILTSNLASISFTDLIVRSFIVRTLLIAIEERKQQFNVHEVIASNDIKGFLKNIKTEIVNDFNQLFEKNIDIFPGKKLFDRNVIKKLANARDEADPLLIEELEMKIDPDFKIETIIKILEKLIDGFLDNVVYKETDKFINFFQDNSYLLVEYLQLPNNTANEIKNIRIDNNLTNEEKIRLFIDKLTIIIKENKKKNVKKGEDNNDELEKIINDDVNELNKKYLSNIKENEEKENISDINKLDIDDVGIENNTNNDIDTLTIEIIGKKEKKDINIIDNEKNKNNNNRKVEDVDELEIVNDIVDLKDKVDKNNIEKKIDIDSLL